MKSHPLRRMAAACLVAIPVSFAAAQPEAVPAPPPPALGSTVTVRLASGDVLTGVLTAADASGIRLIHPLLGELSLPHDQVTSLMEALQPAATAPGEVPAPGVPAAAAPSAGPAPAPVAEPPAEPEKPSNRTLSFFKGWEGSIEAGLNGSDGNTEQVNGRAGIGAKRATQETETTFTATYSFASQDNETSENKARFHLRNDWLIKDSPWRYFAEGIADWDDFQDWDWRLAAFGGVGYEFIKNDTTLLLGRIGAGVSREIGGSDNSIRPEGLLGLDFEHEFTERSKFVSSLTFYPDLDEFGEYRAEASAAYEVLVDPDANLSFKIGVADRYDSTPGEGFRRNDIDYFALLVFKF